MSVQAPGLKVERIEQYAKFIRLKEEWNELLSGSGQSSPFLTHQWFDAWWQSFGKSKELDILLIRGDHNSMVGIAPLMNSEGTLLFIANLEVTDYCDFISREDCRKQYYHVLLSWLKKNSTEFSRMEFVNLPESSPTLYELPELASNYEFACEIVESEVVPSVSLPETYQTYVQSLKRKNRHELRRKIRKLETSGAIRVERITEPSALAAAVPEFIALHRKSSSSKRDFWQKEGMADFFDKLVALFSSENWVEIYFLYVRDRLIGGLVDFLFGDTLFLYNMAYDRIYSSLSPGFYLFSHAIEKAIESGTKTADFLRGSEKYKYFFGAKDRKIYKLTLNRKERKE